MVLHGFSLQFDWYIIQLYNFKQRSAKVNYLVNVTCFFLLTHYFLSKGSGIHGWSEVGHNVLVGAGLGRKPNSGDIEIQRCSSAEGHNFEF